MSKLAYGRRLTHAIDTDDHDDVGLLSLGECKALSILRATLQQELGDLVTKEGAQLACGDVLVSGYTLLYSLDDLEGRLDPDITRHEDIL